MVCVYTVKPQHHDHLWDQKRMVLMLMWSHYQVQMDLKSGCYNEVFLLLKVVTK